MRARELKTVCGAQIHVWNLQDEITMRPTTKHASRIIVPKVQIRRV